MSESTLSQRLEAARSRAFVGRTAELDLFAQAVGAQDPPFTLLWVHGPGGVGKSTLLRRLADDASSAGAHVVPLDVRTCEPSPHGVRSGIGDLPPAAGSTQPGAAGRTVVLLDTAELLAPIDDWLREEYLPSLPDRTVVALASRHPPGPRWRADHGWAQEMRTVRLTNLEPDAARALLAARRVPEARRASVVEMTHGHPLALALVADVLAQRAGDPVVASLTHADLGEVLPALLERFLDEVPSPVYRTALQVFGHARVTTEGLLRAVVGDERAAQCYAWLRTLSFAQAWSSGRLGGLVPHDLARDVLDSDLRLRDEEAWQALHRTIRRYQARRSLDTSGAEQVRAVADLLWFQRASPALRAYESWDAAFSLWAQEARDGDLPQILALVAEHEGEESVRWHEAWWRRQPGAVWVVRSRPGDVHGFVVQPRLDAADSLAAAKELDDPFALAALEHLRRTAPLRPGQHLRLVRSWIGRDGYYRPSPTHQVITGLLTRQWLTEPGLAVSLAYSAQEPVWTPMFAHVDYAHVTSADVEAGGRRFAAYLHDWRVTGPAAWLELLGGREADGAGGGGADGSGDAVEYARRHLREDAAPPPTEAEFAAAVRDAFRAAARPAELARSPLLRSQAVIEAARTADPGREPEARDLRRVLEAAVAALQQDPVRQRLARVLTVTYLTPAATQEAAAARLSLPFSTYRRHLGVALAEVTRALWEQEG